MLNIHDIMETINMIQSENLDIRTITMGISLLDCIDSDCDKSCEKIYNKITRLAGNLVKVGEDIEKEYGIPIINKRISVTPIAMIVAAVILSGVLPTVLVDGAGEALGITVFGEVRLTLSAIIEITIILVAAFLSFKTTNERIRKENHFTWGAIKEVAILFIGIFITMEIVHY